MTCSKHAELVSSMKAAEKDVENEESLFLVQLLTAATLDATPQYNVQEIYDALVESHPWNLLDPLNMLPLLISSDQEAVPDLINTLSRQANAKETIIAVQEALERLERAVHSENDDEEASGQKYASQLVRLIGASENAIPRLKLRQKGPGTTLQPVVAHIAAAIDLVAPLAGREYGRRILSTVCCLIKSVLPWLSQNTGAKGAEYKTTTDFLERLLWTTVSACSTHIHTSLAQRRFATINPRFSMRSGGDPDSERSEEVVQEALDITRLLGITSESLAAGACSSPGELILLAHAPPASIPTDTPFIQKLIPILTSSLQQNIAMDESLAILLTIFAASKSTLPEDIVNPIATLLTPLASTHPDPPTRHVTFRILGLLLSRAPSSVHLSHLSSLLTDCPFPQMRVAAVGLVKEAFLNAISSTDKSPFTSPAFIRALGPALFRPDPPALFASTTEGSLKKFLESSEPARLTECLAFYYVLLKRDTNNVSGLKDRDMLRTVENGLLAPLRNALAKWLNDSSANDDPHVPISLVSLDTVLDRVDGVIASF